MDWARILAFVTGMVDQELLARNEYLAAENRILKAQLKGRLKLSDAERATLGEIGHRLGRQVLGTIATPSTPSPSERSIRPGRAAGAARAQPEPECLCGAMGQVGEGGVLVQGDPLWRALPAASPERVCRTFPCRAESSGEGQRPAVPSGYEHPPRQVCSMPRATGRTLALLPSGGSVNGGGASDEFFDLTGNDASHFSQTQFSTLTPGMRANSRMLLVTMINPSLRAWPPICMSCGPQGVPARSSSARTCP